MAGRKARGPMVEASTTATDSGWQPLTDWLPATAHGVTLVPKQSGTGFAYRLGVVVPRAPDEDEP